jgi:hypothetical protein
MRLVYSEYWNTGGNCYCMEGAVEDCPLSGKTVWFFGSTTAYDVPGFAFFATEEDLHGFIYDSEENYLAEADGFGEPWVVELWKEAFQNAIKVAVSDWDKFVAKDDYKEFLEEYHAYLAEQEYKEDVR